MCALTSAYEYNPGKDKEPVITEHKITPEEKAKSEKDAAEQYAMKKLKKNDKCYDMPTPGGKKKDKKFLLGTLAEQGDLMMILMLAKCYTSQKAEHEFDMTKAAYWYQVCADLDPDAEGRTKEEKFDIITCHGMLGAQYHSGQGVEKDHDKAFKLNSIAHDGGAPGGTYNLGVQYNHGDGVASNPLKAMELYDIACKHKETVHTACGNLGVIHHKAKSWPSAIKYYEKAMKGGNVNSMFNLAILAKNGYGQKKDIKKAVKLFRKAAFKDHTNAMYNLALMYMNGVGVEKSESDALKWLEKAEKLGHKQAKSVLDQMYEVVDEGHDEF